MEAEKRRKDHRKIFLPFSYVLSITNDRSRIRESWRIFLIVYRQQDIQQVSTLMARSAHLAGGRHF